MMVRAKFACQTETRQANGTRTYQFFAAMGEENKQWAKWTPGGQLSITIDNPEAQQFEPGKSYYLDFTEAA